MAYPETFMHEQNHPLWRDDVLGELPYTIGTDGCFADCVAYCWSRKTNTDQGVREFVRMANALGGFRNGLLSWDVIKKITGFTVSKNRPLFGRIYTMRNVLVPSKRGVFSHWVVELRGNLMFDPLKTGGKFVHPIDYFPPIRNNQNQINKRYLV